MTREELTIGQNYKGKFEFKLVAFDSDGDPVLLPLSTYPKDRLYLEKDELDDPKCQVGCCGMHIEQFLRDYKRK